MEETFNFNKNLSYYITVKTVQILIILTVIDVVFMTINDEVIAPIDEVIAPIDEVIAPIVTMFIKGTSIFKAFKQIFASSSGKL